MPHATTHRVLFIDAYDSFTNNIIALLETDLGVQVKSIKIDEPIPDFSKFLQSFSAVVAGPGPGDPRNPEDVGWIRELWNLEEPDLLPVLGICLGFQSLVLAFGGTIDRLGEPRHGVVRRVRGHGESLFQGVDELETVQYHSLYASLGSGDKNERIGPYDAQNSSLKYSDLRPLAWDYEMDNATDKALSVNSPQVLMAVEHKSKPFFGVQFHAESICSSDHARKVFEAWWKIARKWRRPCRGGEPTTILSRTTCVDHKAAQNDPRDDDQLLEYSKTVDKMSIPSISINEIREGAMQHPNAQKYLNGNSHLPAFQSHESRCSVRVTTSIIDVGEATVPSICETLGLTDGDAVILDSEMHIRSDVGEYSIIGVLSPDTLRLDYNVATSRVRRIHNGKTETIDLQYCGGSILTYLKFFIGQCKVENAGTGIPFWGGLMGFISYEACLETIGINHSQTCTREDPQRPDLSFIFVERSIVIDHIQQKIHVQTIKPYDQDWVDKTTLRLQSTRTTSQQMDNPNPFFANAQVSVPEAASYQSKVRACQSAIRAGDSYEICLTTQATIHTQKRLPAWPTYLRLRSLNPAPFGVYVRLGKLTLLSSSPERFLRWSRPKRSSTPNINNGFSHSEKTITCQFRPIKGTVKRRPDPNLPPLSLAEATALLATPKERAENLMIVDLIRHDLHGAVGSGRVHVPKLMVVEEYATLFQLVSVVEGSLTVKDCGDDDNGDIGNLLHENNNLATVDIPDDSSMSKKSQPGKTGIDILSASLPPGSMTGAPKLRSCQILRTLEPRPRGVYSGVVGYMDVGGGGDFSVVIRSAVRWDRDTRQKHGEGDVNGCRGAFTGGDADTGVEEKPAVGDDWSIGAGGAVTALSTEEGEWEEMLAKLRSTLRLFEADN